MDLAFSIFVDCLVVAWNGPFHIGPLHQPVSVGDVLLKVLETLWRAVMTLVYIAAVVTIVALLWSYIIQPAWFPPATKYVTSTASFDDGSAGFAAPPQITNIKTLAVGSTTSQTEKPARCSAEYPLKVSIWNIGKKPIQDVAVNVVGKAQGITTAIVDEPFLRIPLVIPPGRGAYTCFYIERPRGYDPGSLRYTSKIADASYSDTK